MVIEKSLTSNSNSFRLSKPQTLKNSSKMLRPPLPQKYKRIRTQGAGLSHIVRLNKNLTLLEMRKQLESLENTMIEPCLEEFIKTIHGPHVKASELYEKFYYEKFKSFVDLGSFKDRMQEYQDNELKQKRMKKMKQGVI